MIDVYAQRRANVLNLLAPDAVMIIAAAPELIVGRDTHLRYVVDAELYYLTGYTEPDAVLVLDPSAEAPFTMFVRERDAERELWMGKRAGVEGAEQMFGAHRAYPIGDLAKLLPKQLVKANTVYARSAARPELDAITQHLFEHGRPARARTGRGTHIIRDPGDILDEMRLIKDDAEIAFIREACRISGEAFGAVLARVRPGIGEWEIEAAIEFEFRSRGASGPAFPTIAATGTNATVLHYTDNSAPLQDGDLLLIDAGARYRMYCGDITRTVAVNGEFNKRQRALYDVVLAAHDAAISAIAPGRPVDVIHEAATNVLQDGIKRLGLTGELKQYFPHKTSHWLGLDVHDVGPYVRENEKLLLQPGMVLTIEPGLYVPAESIGIRIEDDVLVTQEGREVLTGAAPLP